MKIAMITKLFPEDSFGGGEAYLHEIWKEAKKKYEISLISGWQHDPNLLPEGTYKIDLRSKNKFLNYYRFYKATKKYLKKIKPDIINASCLHIPKTNIPTVLTIYHLGHMMGYVGSSLTSKIQKLLAKKRIKNADKFIAISKSTFNDLLKLGVKKEKIKLIYPGIDTKKFKPKKVKNKKFTIVYPSRISKEKGQHVAIEAIKKIPLEMLKDMELILVGFVSDKEYLNKLKRLAFSWPVKFETNVKNMVKYYQKSDLIVFPTLMYEGFGFTAAEALSCGKPLIASDFPSIREIVGRNGILIKPGDADELSASIEILFDNKKLRTKFGKQGRKSILKKFDWKKAFKEHCKIYEELLK